MHQKTPALICLVLLSVASMAIAETDPELRTARSIALPGDGVDWPVWSGPEGNLTAPGNGVFDGAFGFEQEWTRPLGSAYSGILVVDGRLTTKFSDGTSDFLVALDASTGAELWRYRISDTYKGHDGSDDGPLATPAIDGGVIYGLGAWGGLFAVSLPDGKEQWRRDLVADAGAEKPYYGFATAPTVIGDLLVVETGGADGRSISAFDRETGELRWSAGDDPVMYQSPLTLELGGETLLVAVTNRSLLGLAPETGEVLWKHRHTEGDSLGFLSAQPVPVGEGGILLTDHPESALFQIGKNADGYTVKEAWRSRTLRGGFAIPVSHEGYIYGYSGNFLTCVDAATGESVWKSRPPGEGDLVLVDDHLVILARSGEIVVVEATPEEYREVSRFQALDRGYYTRPSFAGGKVYVRNSADISAVSVTKASSASSARTGRAAVERPGADWDLRGEFGAFVEKLAAAENKSEMVESFLAEHPTLPILEVPNLERSTLEGPNLERSTLEGTLVHFVYHGEVDDLAVAGNFIRDHSEHAMHRVEGTDFYFRTYELPEKAVFTYRFAVFDELMTDPANPEKTNSEDGELSVLATAGWQAPSHLHEPEGQRGSIETLQWESEQLDNEREVQIYLPPGYGEGDDRYPLLVVLVGDQALSMGEMDKSLDNLIGKTVAPVIVAFVPVANWRELGGSRTAEYAKAQAEELIPLLDKTFRTDARRESRGVLGQDPYGGAGFAAMYAALRHPETFSRAAAQSYEHRDLEEELMAAASGEKHDLELVFHWSSYDRYIPFWDFDARRDATILVAALEKNGYRPKTFESHSGAGWGMWQGRMAEILETLFPLQ
ncbi:MAG: PQQ-binding-like beta-propeller repeat protein [Thermoanaerobaculia bacterium]|nr:PQQ-binding-like beta-propeller repeat protein [Thermoanaerobaculia bacterium]